MINLQELFTTVYQSTSQNLKACISNEVSYRIRVLARIADVPMQVFLGAIITERVNQIWMQYGLDEALGGEE